MSISLVLMGASVYFNSIRVAEMQALDLLLEQQEDYSDEINSVLKYSKSNLLTFANTGSIEALFRANEHDGVDPVTGDSNEVLESRLTQLIHVFLDNHPVYHGVVLLDSEGEVLVGAHDSTTDTQTTNYGFSHKSEQYQDIQATLKLPDGAVYYSDIERHNANELPTLMGSTPIYIDGEIKGIVLVEISALPLLNSAVAERRDIETYIVDNKGKLWVKPNNSNESDFSFLLGQGQKSDYALINKERKSVLAVNRVFFDKNDPQRFLSVVHELPKRVVFKNVNEARDAMLVVGLLIILASIFISSRLVSRRIVDPIIRLVEGSRSVGNGDFSARLDESIVKDEFKELYQAFNNYTERSEIELKELEKRANSNEKYLENVVVHLVDALIVIDELGTIESCNPATTHLFGYSEHEMLGKNVITLMPEPDKSEYEAYFLNYLETGVAKIIGKGREVVGQRKDGSVFPMELSVNEYRFEEEKHFIGTLRDISARKAMEQEIKRTDERLMKQYNSYLSLSTFVRRASTNFEQAYNKIIQECAETLRVDWVGLWLFNDKRDTLLCQNYYSSEQKAFFTLPSLLVSEHEYYFSELLMEGGLLANDRTPLLSDFPKQDNPPASILQLPIRKYKSISGVFNLVNQDETRVLRADETQYVKSLSMLVEVLLEEESRRRVREQLKEKNKELELASEMKSQFLSNMSHELRTPLNAIIGFSELLKDGVLGPLTDEQGQYSTEIFDSGSHLLDLINGILDLSKIEAGKELLELDEVSVQSILQNSLYMVRDQASERNISITESSDEEITACWLDGRKTKQILINLLSNAVKFTPEGGKIALSAMIDKMPNLEFKFDDSELIQCEGQYLKLSVSDTGIGISEENIDKLFRPFEQIDGSLTREFEGTGLGLSLVKAMAELHGGFVTVVSTPGEGSTFSVYLPYKEAEAGNKPLVLIIDDDPNAIELTDKQLNSLGYRSRSVKSAEEALVWLGENERPTWIVLDELLPGMQGMEFLERLKNENEYAEYNDIPVIVISIKGSDVAQQYYQNGAFSVMDKPVSKEGLKQIILQLSATSQ